MAAAFAHGAEAIQMGTRFVSCSEAFVPKRPLTTAGRRSASSAPKARKTTEPSSTRLFEGSCSLVTFAPNGQTPAFAAEVRGGWRVTWNRPTEGGASGVLWHGRADGYASHRCLGDWHPFDALRTVLREQGRRR